jgi:hypothetical protein
VEIDWPLVAFEPRTGHLCAVRVEPEAGPIKRDTVIAVELPDETDQESRGVGHPRILSNTPRRPPAEPEPKCAADG